jgi:hypothetical protein
MTTTDCKDSLIEYLRAEVDRLKQENEALRKTYDPDGWRVEIERLRALQPSGGRAVLEEFVGKIRKAGE